MRYLAVDTETTGFDPIYDRLLTVNFYSPDKDKTLVLEHPKQRDRIQRLLATSRAKVYFNAKFDIAFLYGARYKLGGPQLDAAIYARVALTDVPSYSLKALSRLFLDEAYEEALEIRELLSKEDKRCSKLPLSDKLISLIQRVPLDKQFTGFYHLLQELQPRLYKRFKGVKLTKGLVQRIRDLHTHCPKDSKHYPYLKEMTDYLGEGGFACIPIKLLKRYGGKDARCTYKLFDLIRSEFSDRYKYILNQEHETLPIVVKMEHRGIRIDVAYTKKLLKAALKRRDELETTIKDRIHVDNLRSSVQLAEKLFDEQGIYAPKPTDYTDKGQVSAKALSLLRRGGGIAKKILRWRKLDKAISTYLIPILEKSDKNCILRPRFNQNGARTGRWSSNNPNLQNIPRAGSGIIGRVRNCFIAREGYVLCFIDYNQIELRLAAHFTEDPNMVKAIIDGADLHDLTCRHLFGIDKEDPDWKTKRQISKTANFAMLYGIGPKSFINALLMQTGILIDLDESKRIISEFKTAYPSIQALFYAVKDEVTNTGGITNPYGRFVSVNFRESYKGVNYLIQSTAADIMQQRLNYCNRYMADNEIDGNILASVHDEIIFELWRSELEICKQLRKLMEEHKLFKVPLTCSLMCGSRWGKKKDYTA